MKVISVMKTGEFINLPLLKHIDYFDKWAEWLITIQLFGELPSELRHYFSPVGSNNIE